MKKTCIGPGADGGRCELEVHGHSLCSAHLRQFHKGGELRPLKSVLPERLCSYAAPDGTACGLKHWAKDLCQRHYKMQWRGYELRPLNEVPERTKEVRLCTVIFDDGSPCERPFKAHGMCGMHNKRQEAGTPLGAPVVVRGRPRKEEVVKEQKPAKPAKPWNPNALEHAGRGMSKPPGGSGNVTLAAFGSTTRIDPRMYWDAWRSLCHHVPREELAELADALGIIEGLREAAA